MNAQSKNPSAKKKIEQNTQDEWKGPSNTKKSEVTEILNLHFEDPVSTKTDNRGLHKASIHEIAATAKHFNHRHQY